MKEYRDAKVTQITEQRSNAKVKTNSKCHRHKNTSDNT
jgi:hypothetical protein